MKAKFPFDVFLSHNSKDKPRVRKLAERLKSAGLRVWFDEWNVRSGDIIALKVDEGLEQSRVLLLCVSPNALASGWVGLERSTAIHRDPANEGRRFIPLLLSDCDLPDTLRRYKYVDWRGEAEEAFAELLEACWPEAAEAAPTAQRPVLDSSERKNEPSVQTQPLAEFERKLTGHRDWVRSLAVSPDGKWAASGSDDKTVKIWDLESGACRATLAGHTDDVMSVAITPDGTRVLSGSQDHTIRVWDASEGKSLACWVASEHYVLSVVPMADGRRVITAGASVDPALKVWDIATQKCLRTLDGHTNATTSVSLARDQIRVVSGSYDRTIRLWNLETGEVMATLRGHSDRVNSVQVTPEGRFAVSGSDDNTVKVWDLAAGTCVGTLEGHKSYVYSVAISPDGDWIASTGFTDESVRLWDWKSGACLQVIELQGNDPEPISVAFDPTGMRLIAGDCGGGIHVYRLTGVRPSPPPEAARRYVNAKVVLLGEGTVGKTSLAHRLVEDQYVVRDRTHGMNVWRLDLPLPPDASLEREALLWDLAGQEDYRLIHQLFLDETALALLLINPQKDNPFAEAGDWLKALETAGGIHQSKREAAKLLVFSQIDVGGMKLGNAKIDRFREQHGFASWLGTSAKTGENCSDTENAGQPSKLKQLIAASIPWDQLPWTSTPVCWPN